MKKILLLTTLFCVSLYGNMSFSAEDNIFSSIADITPVQQQKLTQIQFNFNQKNNVIESRLNDYTHKMELARTNDTLPASQKSLLTSAYERNISTLKKQQDILKNETDELYKSVLTNEQFQQYKILYDNSLKSDIKENIKK